MPLDTNFTNQKFKQVGTRPLRPDGVDKVTGRAKYGADYNAPGQLIALVRRNGGTLPSSNRGRRLCTRQQRTMTPTW